MINPSARHRKLGRTATIGTASLVAIGLSITGCSGSGSTTEPANGESSGEIRVQVETSKLAGLQAVADMFMEENADTTVTFETITSDQKATTNALTLSSADAPDLGVGATNATAYAQLLENDSLEPLDDVWESADLENLFGEDVASTLVAQDGNHYGALFEKQLYNIVYFNNDKFDELGIDVPENHQIQSNEELYEITDALREGDLEPLCIGGTSNYQLGWLLDGQLAATASPELLTSYLNSGQPGNTDEVDYTDPAFVESLQQIQDWYENDVFQAGMLGQNYDTALANFEAGNCGMLLSSATATTIFDADGVAFDYDWLLPPSESGPTVPTTYAGSTFVIPKTAANPELAKKFLEFFYEPESVLAYTEQNGSLPAITGLPADRLEQVLPETVTELLAFVEENGADSGWTSVAPGALGQGFIDPEIQKQLNGELTPKEVAANQQENYEEFAAANG